MDEYAMCTRLGKMFMDMKYGFFLNLKWYMGFLVAMHWNSTLDGHTSYALNGLSVWLYVLLDVLSM